jgi:hypothetical protein
MHSQHGEVALQLGLVAQRCQLRIIITVVAYHLWRTIPNSEVAMYSCTSCRDCQKGKKTRCSTRDVSNAIPKADRGMIYDNASRS